MPLWYSFIALMRSTVHANDLGSFNGANARAISHRYRCAVYGVDIDHRIVRLAQLFNKTGRTSFLIASAESLPFANDSFDKMYGISVLEHFTDGAAAIGEANRCLKPAGVLAFTTDSFELGELWSGSQKLHSEKYFVPRYYSKRELTREIESAGLQLLHAEPILRHWSTGFLFELSVRFSIVKSAAFILLPLLRLIEHAYGSTDAGYMEMVCAAKLSIQTPEQVE